VPRAGAGAGRANFFQTTLPLSRKFKPGCLRRRRETGCFYFRPCGLVHKSETKVDSAGGHTQLRRRFPMILNLALVVLITVVVAVVAATLNNHGRLAEAKRS